MKEECKEKTDGSGVSSLTATNAKQGFSAD